MCTGAGDGEVTKHMASFYTNVYTTETSGPMVTRLKNKGYRYEAVIYHSDSVIWFSSYFPCFAID